MGVAVGSSEHEKQQRGMVQGVATDEQSADQSSMPLSIGPAPQLPSSFPTPHLDAQNQAVNGLNSSASDLGADAYGLSDAPTQSLLGPEPSPSAGSPASSPSVGSPSVGSPA